MTTDILLAVSALLIAAGLYLFRQKTRLNNKRANLHFRKTLAVMFFFLGGLALVLAWVNISNSYTLPSAAPADDSTGLDPFRSTHPLKPGQHAHAPQAAADQWELPAAAAGHGGKVLDPAAQLKRSQELNDELNKINAALKENPYDAITYANRGSIYAMMKSYDLAENDFRTALNYNNTLTKAAFDLSEMEFQQGKYDNARPGFEALKHDPTLGDLATYKVFLCDMLGGHEGVADRELDALNQADSGASHYFANIAWFLYHNKTDEARGWLRGASYIYPPYKVSLYSSTLTDLGYLPIPAQP